MSVSDEDTELERLVGSTVADKYRLDRVIGRGGMGGVFQATHTVINKRVAIKFLLKDATRDRDAVVRFQREALAASAVESAHIVEIFDSGMNDQGLPFLVMELLRGEDLRARLRREERLSPEVAAHITSQILRGLSRAHEAGIVHRDLKPDNVFLCDRDDDPMFVKIVDFGISKLANETTLDTLTRRGTVLGTAFYMSPEQAQGFPDIDGRTDLFSVGAILYEMLAGRPPHVGNTYEAVLVAICTRDPDDVRAFAPSVPEALWRVILRALARERADRFASSQEFLEALTQALPNAVRAPRFTSARSPDDAAPGVTAGSLERGSFATAAGTSLKSRSVNRTREKRRLAITGVMLVLGGFTVALLLMSRTRGSASGSYPEPSLGSSRPGTSAASDAGAKPSTVSPAATDPLLAEPATAPSGTGTADAGSSVVAPSTKTPSVRRPTSTRTKAAGTARTTATDSRLGSGKKPDSSTSGKARPLGLKTGGP